MGWCQEFGVQIAVGCDHAMSAGRDACSCPDCGTVCPGRFAGCAIVWHASPMAATVRSTLPALGAAPMAAPGAVRNGKSTVMADETFATEAASRSATGPVLDVPVLDVPVPDVPVPDVPVPDVPVPDVPNPVPAQESPVAEVEEELRNLCADLTFAVRRLSREVDRLAAEPRTEVDTVLREVDRRFAWLTTEVSDRLVTLGNEIVVLQRHLGAGRD